MDEKEKERENDWDKAWCSLVEGDEQMDWPKSQTSIKCCHACATYFFVFGINTTAYHLGPNSLHLLPLKSSVDEDQRENEMG